MNLKLRYASPGDANDISHLYKQAYAPPGGGLAHEHYPYPQLLMPDHLVRTYLNHPNICWIVADWGGELVGSAAAQRNIGTIDDRVSEVFGIVVSEDHRGKGYGTKLLAHLCEELRDQTEFILCEARTAEYGWRIAEKVGFHPLGLEPFGHHTPDGFETMLLTGKCPAQKTPAVVSPQVEALASRVCGISSQPKPKPLFASGERNEIIERNDSNNNAREVANMSQASSLSALQIKVRQDDAKGKVFMENWRTRGLHYSGVIGLNRLEGVDVQRMRYRREYHIASIEEEDVGCIRLVWDLLDRRARMLEMQVLVEGIQGILMSETISSVARRKDQEHLTIVLDVRADSVMLHNTLTQLGFFPTVYYPALISDQKCRCDAVQFTLLLGCEFDTSLRFLERVNWEDAATVVNSVRAHHAPPCDCTRTSGNSTIE
jgi:GNAT superfamily N-acetyltransferase